MSFPHCQWATCKRLAQVFEDGWHFCSAHLLEHEDQRDHPTRDGYDTPLAEILPALHAQGMTDVLIAAHTGHNSHHVGDVRRSLGLPVLARPVGGCGTSAGYEKHRTRKEAPCDACRAAKRLYDRGRKRAQRRAVSLSA